MVGRPKKLCSKCNLSQTTWLNVLYDTSQWDVALLFPSGSFIIDNTDSEVSEITNAHFDSHE